MPVNIGHGISPYKNEYKNICYFS